jgi:hypothetical protein
MEPISSSNSSRLWLLLQGPAAALLVAGAFVCLHYAAERRRAIRRTIQSTLPASRRQQGRSTGSGIGIGRLRRKSRDSSAARRADWTGGADEYQIDLAPHGDDDDGDGDGDDDDGDGDDGSSCSNLTREVADHVFGLLMAEDSNVAV